MKDIIIGDKKSSSCSAVIYFEHPEVQNIISQNSQLYWCHEEFTRTSIFILKDTDEGEALTALLHCKSSLECVENFLLNIALSNMDVSDFRIIMENCRKSSFGDGIKYNQQQLRKVMGV